MKDTNARIYRRHRPGCKHHGVEDSRAKLDCNCPLYGDGYMEGKRVLRKSLDTRNQAVASKKLADLMVQYQAGGQSKEPQPSKKPVNAAADNFLDYHGTLTPEGEYRRIRVGFSTYRKYRNSVRQLQAFCATRGIAYIADVGLEEFDAFVAARHLDTTTSRNEIQLLRKFWGFCLRRKWVSENVPKNFEMPKSAVENDVEPYTALHESKILSACETFDRCSYERLRARNGGPFSIHGTVY
jgi:integrase-like protein